MEISTNRSFTQQLNNQSLADRQRQDNELELETQQADVNVAAEDRATTAAPIEAANSSERGENRTNEQIVRPLPSSSPQDESNPEETLGSQLDVRA